MTLNWGCLKVETPLVPIEHIGEGSKTLYGNQISDVCVVGSASLLEVAFWSEEKEGTGGAVLDVDVLPAAGCIASEGGVTER